VTASTAASSSESLDFMVEKSDAFENVMIWLGENWLKHLKREASRDFAK
jgi:hypothetical protein